MRKHRGKPSGQDKYVTLAGIGAAFWGATGLV